MDVEFAEQSEGEFRVFLAVGQFFGTPNDLPDNLFIAAQFEVGANLFGIAAIDAVPNPEGSSDFETILGYSLVNAPLHIELEYDLLTQTLLGHIQGLPGPISQMAFAVTDVPPIANPQLAIFAQAGNTSFGGSEPSRVRVAVDNLQTNLVAPQYFLTNSPLRLNGVDYSDTFAGDPSGVLYGFGPGINYAPELQLTLPVTGPGQEIILDGETNLNVGLYRDEFLLNIRGTFVLPFVESEIIVTPGGSIDYFIEDAYIAQGVGNDFLVNFGLDENTAPTALVFGDGSVVESKILALNGGDSLDLDSTPGTNDDITLFTWAIDVDVNGVIGGGDIVLNGLPGVTLSPRGENILINTAIVPGFALGNRQILLQVFDSEELSDLAATVVAVTPALASVNLTNLTRPGANDIRLGETYKMVAYGEADLGLVEAKLLNAERLLANDPQVGPTIQLGEVGVGVYEGVAVLEDHQDGDGFTPANLLGHASATGFATFVDAAVTLALTPFSKKRTLLPLADTTVRANNANNNYGALTYIDVQKSRRSLVRFSQAEILAAASLGQITAAKLKLEIANNTGNWGANGRAVDVHRLLVDWGEYSATFNLSRV